MSRKKVLFAIPSLDRGGPDRVFFDLMRGFDRDRFDPALAVSASKGFYLDRLPGDVTVNQVSNDKGIRGRYPVMPLARLVRSHQPDMLLATLRMVMTAGFAKPFLPRRTKLVLRVANQISSNVAELQAAAPLKHRISHWIMRRALLSADHIVCQSRDMEEDIKASLGGRVSTSVIGNPIELAFVQDLAAQGTVQLKGAPKLLCVARLMPQKGIDILLRAFALLKAGEPNAHLTLIGDGPEREALEVLAQELGIGDAVDFAGFQENPYPAMAAADLFVLASRYEGFPNVVLEALACGTPVVASDCPGATRDILFPEEVGFLAPAEDPEGFAETMRQALAAGALDARAVADACGQRHDFRKIVSAYEALCP